MEAIIKTAFPWIETSVEQLKLKLAELNGDAKAKEMIMHIDLRNIQQSDGNESHTFYEDVGSTSSFVVRAREIVSHGELAELNGDAKAKEMIMHIDLRNIQQSDGNESHTFYEDVGSTSSFVVRAREIVSHGESKTKPHDLQHEGNLSCGKMGNIISEASKTLSSLLEAALFWLPPIEEATRLIDIFISVAGNNTFFYFDSSWFRAILLLPAVINDSSVETVQVFFLAAMYVLAGQEMEMAYTYLGIAMRAAMANGMHKNFSLKSDFDNNLAKSKRRLFGGVCIIERRFRNSSCL
ncbi:uncharacterized protein ZBAI_08148 [Zygosaccharomyces bailii ISA1307]|nr:uncharacterized protein ZBAI_08148 [Zygosaccharomyces bailii ISA1307]